MKINNLIFLNSILLLGIVGCSNNKNSKSYSNEQSQITQKKVFNRPTSQLFKFENDTILQIGILYWVKENEILFELKTKNKINGKECSIADTAISNQELGRGLYYDEKMNDEMFPVDEYIVNRNTYNVTIGVEFSNEFNIGDSLFFPRLSATVISEIYNNDCPLSSKGTLRCIKKIVNNSKY